MVTRSPSLLWHLTRRVLVLRLARKTQTSSFGIRSLRLDFTGKSPCLDGLSFSHARFWVGTSLRGHRGQITAIQFVDATPDAASTSTYHSPGYVLTASKDTFLKLWDLSTQHCIQTIVGHRSEVWSLALDAGKDLIFTGGGDGELKAWRLDHDALGTGIRESEAGEVSPLITSCAGSSTLIY